MKQLSDSGHDLGAVFGSLSGISCTVKLLWTCSAYE